MYIGPWQEYSLSKERRRNTTNNNNLTSEFRKGIEDAISNTLDPTAAQAAIEAMEMYLKQHQISSGDGGVRLPALQQQAQSQVRRPRNLYHPNAFANDTKLPLINTTLSTPPSSSSRIRKVNSARDKIPSAASTPVSVRSTQSEPISSTKFPNVFNNTNGSNNNSSRRMDPSKTSTRRNHGKSSRSHLAATTAAMGIAQFDNMDPPMFHQTKSSNNRTIPPISSTAQYYDTNAAIEILKMDRMERAKVEIGKLAGWKVPKNPNESSKSNKAKKSKDSGVVDAGKEEKLGQIMTMRELYMTHLTDNNPSAATTAATSVATNTLPSTVNINTKVVQQEHTLSSSPIGSPCIQDIDVTDKELSVVSKYFKTTKSGTTTKQQHQEEEQRAMQQAEETVHSPQRQTQTQGLPPPYHALMANDNDEHDQSDVEQQGDDDVFNISQSHKSITSRPRTEQEAPFMDELFTGGGVDSLLKWSAQLEFDDF